MVSLIRKASAYGILKAHELAIPTPQQSYRDRRHLVALSNTDSTNLFAFNANAASSRDSAKTSSEDPNISSTAQNTLYARVMKAISCSLALNLGKNPKWSVINSQTCVNEDSVGAGSFDGLAESKTVSFEVRWSESGILTARGVPSFVPKLYRLCDFISPKIVISFLFMPLLLLPAGLKAAFCGVEPRAKRNVCPVIRKIQASVRLKLRRLGHDLPNDAQWVRVRVAEDETRQGITHNAESSTSGHTEILWPADYCLCTTPPSPKVSRSDDSTDDTGILDPIERAETWFNGRFERARANEAAKQEMERKARRPKASDLADDQNSLDVVSPLEHRPSAQDASGVYPTPPDGVPSHAHDTPMSDKDHHFEDTGEIQMAHGDPQLNYSDHGQSNVFDINDMDVGLTEDDFAFFDEPGVQGIDTQETNVSPRDETLHDDTAATVDARLPPGVKRDADMSLDAVEQTTSSISGMPLHMI